MGDPCACAVSAPCAPSRSPRSLEYARVLVDAVADDAARQGAAMAIRAWLPPRFLPPQVTIASTVPSADAVGARMFGATATEPPLSSDDVLFWRNDLL